MKKSLVIGIIGIILTIGTMLTACGTMGNLNSNVNKVVTTYQRSTSKEHCARVYIGGTVQVLGVNGNMSPLKYIAKARDVILIPPGPSTININSFNRRGDDVPRYPGIELEWEAEAGKIYFVSSSDANVAFMNISFRVRELDTMTDENLVSVDKSRISDKDALRRDVEEAVAKLK